MKKIYLIPIILIILLSMFMTTTLAFTITELPPYSQGNMFMFCIEKGGMIKFNDVYDGEIDDGALNNENPSYNTPTYTAVGTYDLPKEIAYALSEKDATLQEKQYAIWYSAMNEGRKLANDPGDIDLADMPEYQEILRIEEEIKDLEDTMVGSVTKKSDTAKLINEITMQNKSLEQELQKTKQQVEEWGTDLDTTYAQKIYDNNEVQIKNLEENGGDASELENLRAQNQKLKEIIDTKNYNLYVAFIEECIKENNDRILELQNDVNKDDTELTTEEITVKELKLKLAEAKELLKKEYDKLYSVASRLLEEGKVYKQFYEEMQKQGGYHPTAEKVTTKLVKKSNNTYIAGPFELNYIESSINDKNFSYIKEMYLVDQEENKITDIEIIDCEQYANGNEKYPASGAKFYIKFEANESDILEDTDRDTRTWKEGRYRYTETTTVKTYSVKLMVEFRYLKDCTGKYTRYEGKGDIFTWHRRTSEDGSYWIANKSGSYKAQTLISVSTSNTAYNYDEPTRVWENYILEVEANRKDTDTDTDTDYTGGRKRRRRPEVAGGGGGSNYNPKDPTPTPTQKPTITPEPEPTPEPLKLTMQVAGYVFADIPANKENIANGLLDYNSNDKLLEGIEVAIYEENGDLVRLIQEYEENPEISVENAEIRTNPTITDKNGYYSFKGLDPDKKYYIEYRYNGLTYEATTYKASTENSDGNAYSGEAWKINSKAVENINERITLNNIYGEISSYPNNYKKAYDIGLGVGEYNKTYKQEELVSIYALINNNIENYINSNKKYPDILEIYKNIYNNQIGNDSEIANKLQFIEDSKISAYTSANGDTKDLYPIYEEFAIEEQKVKIDEIYEPIYVGQKYINLGIKEREEFDLSLAKDVYKAEVQINGKVQNYNYNNVDIDYTDESWSAYVKGSDIGYDRNIYAADYLAKDIGIDNLEVYVTYRIALRNQTAPIIAGVTKIIDYYDTEYTYVGNAENNTYTGLNQGKVYIGNSKGEKVSNAIWTNGEINGKYNVGFITFENGELSLANNEDKFIYATFKVNKNADNLLYSDGEITADGTVVKQAVDAKQNIVEIGGYKTYYSDTKNYSNGKNIEARGIAGVIDRDSMVGNLNPNIEEDINKEDDSDKASGFSLLVDWSNFRALTGNVWEELPTENSINENTRLGNGIKDANEVNIKNVTVKVLINGSENIAKGYVRETDGTYLWKDLIGVTDDNGNYSFTGYIPGDYKVRFTYGNVSEDGSGNLTEEMKKYNGQDYKSTIYNNDATVIDTRPYWYSIDSDKLKSDAKDSWIRREEVNSDYLELNNKESNLLKKDSVNPREKANKTWMLAETDKLVFEVEYARTGTESVINPNDNHVYNVQNIDLGLVERPRSQLLIEKDVSNVKLILSDNTVLFDAILNSEGKLEVTNSNIGVIKRLAKTYDIKTTPANFGVGQNGQITMNIDEELMQGATINITYKVTATNIGEIDYTTKEFYYNGTKGTDSEISKTSATTVVDYVSNNLGISQISSEWAVIDGNAVKTMVEYTSDTAGLSNTDYTAQTVDKYNNILKTNALGVELKPGEKAETNLLLSTAISPENDEDDLRYDNILELVESKNEVGRRHELSILGNQNPLKDVEELDSGKAETVLIIPPFGVSDTLATQISIAIILIAAFGIGVYYIKKRVLK